MIRPFKARFPVRPFGRSFPAGILTPSPKTETMPDHHRGDEKVVWHAPRYGVAGSTIAETRRNMRFYGLGSPIGRLLKLSDRHSYRRLPAYAKRRTAENRHFFSTTMSKGGAPWRR